MFIETEKLHALTRRYTSPDENAFYPHLLPDPILPIIDYPRILNPNRINYNDHIMNVYLDKILPGLTTPTSDASAVRIILSTVASTFTANTYVTLICNSTGRRLRLTSPCCRR